MTGAGAPRAVIFDVGEVLFHWDLRALFAPLLPDACALDQFVRDVISPEWHFQSDQGLPLDEMVAERIGRFPQHRAAIEAYATRFNDSITGPVAGMHDLVAQLDAAGVPLFAITNFGAEFWDGFRPTQPIFDRFRDIVVSGHEKLAKPDPAIFELALSRFGLAPADALFIDDRGENVAAAEACGIASYRFVAAPQCTEWLVGQGIEAAG